MSDFFLLYNRAHAIPSVNIPQTAYATTEGTTFSISCSVSSTTAVTNVSWQRTINGQTSSISIDDVNFSGATTGSPSLTIITASITDTGTYTCFATNSAGTGSDSTQVTVSGTIPSVNIPQTAYATTEGTNFSISCSVSSTTAVTNVSWQRTINGQTSSIIIDDVNFSGATTGSPSLTIITASITDTGTYTCFASNSAGIGSDSTQVTVSGTGESCIPYVPMQCDSVSDVPTVTVGQSSYSVTAGSSITLTCTVSANPTHTNVFWQRDVGSGSQVITIDGVNYSGSQVNAPSITIIVSEIGDAGTYTCFAVNSVGTGQSSTTLTVTGSIPTVTVSQTMVSVFTGTTVTLQCSVSANPTHTSVFWQFTPPNGGTTTLSIDNANHGGSSVNSPSLTVFNANSLDQGTYVCFASNLVGTGLSSQVLLSVTGSLPVVTIAQQSYSVVTGQSVTLACTVSASPTHFNVFWQRIDNNVTSSISIDGSKYSGSTVNNPSLTITNADSNDNTSYTCSATNAVGTGTSGQTTLGVTGSKANVCPWSPLPSNPIQLSLDSQSHWYVQCLPHLPIPMFFGSV
ncbi:Titin [Mizuhopecten yessoensis]|uniref:Titin n=1 Tax=Mizuhopecten yessoensis TaxID=6573 RepID=A0A210QY27_MIZYE|nr:Titin [Mizuhopecten yessoensis]